MCSSYSVCRVQGIRTYAMDSTFLLLYVLKCALKVQESFTEINVIPSQRNTSKFHMVKKTKKGKKK